MYSNEAFSFIWYLDHSVTWIKLSLQTVSYLIQADNRFPMRHYHNRGLIALPIFFTRSIISRRGLNSGDMCIAWCMYVHILCVDGYHISRSCEKLVWIHFCVSTACDIEFTITKVYYAISVILNSVRGWETFLLKIACGGSWGAGSHVNSPFPPSPYTSPPSRLRNSPAASIVSGASPRVVQSGVFT